jgi:hypothetical protein
VAIGTRGHVLRHDQGKVLYLRTAFKPSMLQRFRGLAPHLAPHFFQHCFSSVLVTGCRGSLPYCNGRQHLQVRSRSVTVVVNHAVVCLLIVPNLQLCLNTIADTLRTPL